MKMLICSKSKLSRELGGPRVLLEIGEGLRRLGWTVDVNTPEDLGVPPAWNGSLEERKRYVEALAAHLRGCAQDYDVIEVDHEFYPRPRAELPAQTLLVARSVLLFQHFKHIALPTSPSLRAQLGRLVRGPARRRFHAELMAQSDRTVAEADLVNVSNEDDRKALVAQGIAPERVVVIPYGLDDARFEALSQVVPPQSGPPVIGFVGTFDYRKGALDFPRLVARVLRDVPQARFRLLGTRGHLRDAAQVLHCFPRAHRAHLDVVPAFESAALPRLLSGVSLGVFPSYLEGFGFGVLEMLGASIPTVAYDAPGPPMMLTPDQLVPVGDADAMADWVIRMCKDPAARTAAGRVARQTALRFRWADICQMTASAYEDARARLLQA
jgi:glycosyltransferase involved in cell wall biosynthesis